MPEGFLINLNFKTMLYPNILETIGKTPLVKINKLIDNPNVNLYLKLEGQNPGGSIKDRAALYMIEKAEQSGKLKKDKTILEATSGNMGIALAMVGAYKGYKVKIVMSAGVSEERKKMLRAFGTDLILTAPDSGTYGAITKAKKLVKNNPNKYWFADQFNNPDNAEAHYQGIAKEILDEVKDIHTIVIASGTSGTLMGLAKKIRENSPKIKTVAVFPKGGYQIQGIQNPKEDFIGKVYQESLIDEYIIVEPKDAFSMVRKTARLEGLFLGMSSGASLFVAQQIAQKIKKGNIVAISPDRGERYLSTDLYK